MARALDVIGEWWTLLIIRDALRGTTRFDDFQASLGIARNVLSVRLRRLTENGILERVAYQERPVRHEYRLTTKGRELFPVLAALMRWGDQWTATEGGPPVLLHHDSCDNDTEPVLSCSHCGEPLTADNTSNRPSPALAELIALGRVPAPPGLTAETG